MRCDKCGWNSEDKNFFYTLRVSDRIYHLCSVCWAELYGLIEFKKEEKLISEIEGGRF